MNTIGQDRGTRTWRAAAHLAALLPIPFGSIIGPIVIWILRRDCSVVVDDAKEAVSFQISAQIYYFLILLGCAAACVAAGLLLHGSTRYTYGFGFAFAAFIIVWRIGWTIVVIRAAVAASVGRRFRYPFAIPFVK